MKLDPVQVEQLKHALEVLSAIEEHTAEGSPVHPGALLMDDEETIAVHIEIARGSLADILEAQ